MLGSRLAGSFPFYLAGSWDILGVQNTFFPKKLKNSISLGAPEAVFQSEISVFLPCTVKRQGAR